MYVYVWREAWENLSMLLLINKYLYILTFHISRKNIAFFLIIFPYAEDQRIKQYSSENSALNLSDSIDYMESYLRWI